MQVGNCLVVIKHLLKMLLQIPTLTIFTLIMSSFGAEANECYREGKTWSNLPINGSIDVIDTFHLDLRQCTQAQYIHLRTVPSPRLTCIFGIPEFRVTRKSRQSDCTWYSVGIPHNAILRNSIVVEFRITRF